MKKILLSLMTLALVAATLVGASVAYFSDTETSVGNTITAGTIDIAVDGENPWEATYSAQLADMKPGDLYAKEMEFTIENVGTNPVVVWKQFEVTDQNTGTVSEPECSDQGGIWANPNGPCDWDGNTDNNDLASVIHYSMIVGGVPVITEDMDYMVSDVDDLWMPLGSIEPGASLVVTQNYKMDEDAGNEYQGDEMNFDIVLYAEQYMAPGPTHTTGGVFLDNKNGDPNWTPVVDGTWGHLSWDGSGNYILNAYGLDTGVTYRVAYFDEGTSSETAISGYSAPAGDGSLTISGTYAGFNTNTDAKYWLRSKVDPIVKTIKRQS